MELVFSTEKTGNCWIGPSVRNLEQFTFKIHALCFFTEDDFFGKSPTSQMYYLNNTNDKRDMWTSAYIVLKSFKTSFALRGNEMDNQKSD